MNTDTMNADTGDARGPSGRAGEDPAAPSCGLPAVSRRRAARGAEPIFLHASWRTASTWFWLKFRANGATLCYYEPFHEDLATLTRARAQSLGPGSWKTGASRHPASSPYFLEFRPLIRRSGGVRLYRPEIAHEWFMPQGGIAGRLRSQELRYVGLLLRHADRREKTPVFGFTRSLGRLAALKRHFGGTHIFLCRNLWTQWASYIGHSAAGNRYFLETMLRILLQAQDRFFAAVINPYLVRAVARGLPAPCGNGDLAARLLDTLAEAELFGLFMALHGYLYIAAQASADLAIDATRLARERPYRETIANRLSAQTGLAIDLADVQDVAQAHWVAPDGIDWQGIRDTLDFAGRVLDPPFARGELVRSGERLIDDTIAEMQTGERYLARPRAEIARLNDACAAVAAERDALRSAVERLAGEREAAMKERACARAEGDALARALRPAEGDAAARERDEEITAPPRRRGRRRAR
jgi:phage shock protein A